MPESDKSNKRSSMGKILLAVVWPPAVLLFVSALIGLVLAGLIEAFPQVGVAIDESLVLKFALTAAVNVISLILIVVPLFHYFFSKDADKKSILGLQRPPRLQDAGLVVLAFGTYFLTSALLVNLASNLLPFVDLNQPQELGLAPPQAIAEYMVIFAMLVIVAPVAEELIFRGFMFRALREQMTFWPATILVSIAFGIAHGQWNVGIDTFALSIFLCGLREYSGSLWAPILLHAAKNLLAFTILFVYPDLIPSLNQ